MIFQKYIVLAAAALLLLFAGCVNAPDSSTQVEATQNTTTSTSTNSPAEEFVNNAGDPIINCDLDDPDDPAECFEDAFATCQHAVGTFWTTSDGFPLAFESFGVTESEKCLVRVTVLEDDPSVTPFAGKVANCLIVQTPASDKHPDAFYDSYFIGPSTCTGTYVDAIITASAESDSTTTTDPVEPEPTPEASVKEFSIVVNEGGVDGEDTFTVQKGDQVTLHITVDMKDVSFNGEQILAPAQKGLSADDYIFNSGHLKPGQTKSFTFIADTSFDFGIYWPGPAVLKGKGHIVVEGN